MGQVEEEGDRREGERRSAYENRGKSQTFKSQKEEQRVDDSETKQRRAKEDEMRYNKTQQFTEQMDQLCRPNYREGEVGALQGDKNKKDRKGRGTLNQNGGVEVKT